MFHEDKRKGLPGSRGLKYLAVGVVIGAVGAFLAFSNSMGIPVEPTPTLPTIPTPLPATSLPMADNTMLAQTFPDDPHILSSFAVNEVSGQIALSYWNGFHNTLELRRWNRGHIGSVPVVTLGRGDYKRLSFNLMAPMLAASSGQNVGLYDLTSNLVMGPFREGTEGVFSPDGQWLAISHATQKIDVSRGIEGPSTTFITEGYPYDMVFSPDSRMLAVVTLDDHTANKMHVEVFTLLPSLERIHLYTLEGSASSNITFSLDSTQIAVASQDSVHLVSLTDGEQRYFDTPKTTIRRVAFNVDGTWLAAGGGDSAAGDESGVYFYRLSETSPLPPDLSNVQFIPMPLRDVRDIQFVTEGLLVSDSSSTITLYRWNGDVWGNPSVVLTEKDLE